MLNKNIFPKSAAICIHENKFIGVWFASTGGRGKKTTTGDAIHHRHSEQGLERTWPKHT